MQRWQSSIDDSSLEILVIPRFRDRKLECMALE
jgi:hypothetical protein